MEWYRTTRPALAHEYADLKAELENYGDADSHYVLDVRKRMPPDAHERRRAEFNRIANHPISEQQKCPA
jgi:hypothetical protein